MTPPTSSDVVWDFALRAIELAVETIPDPIARLEASAQLGLALHHARSLATAETQKEVREAAGDGVSYIRYENDGDPPHLGIVPDSRSRGWT